MINKMIIGSYKNNVLTKRLFLFTNASQPFSTKIDEVPDKEIIYNWKRELLYGATYSNHKTYDTFSVTCTLHFYWSFNYYYYCFY